MCCFETCTFLPESTWVIIHKLRACTQGLLDSTYVPNGNSCAIFRPNGSSVGAEAAVLGGGAVRGAQLGGAEPERELTLTVVGGSTTTTIGDGSAGNVLFVAWLSSIVEGTGDANTRMHTHRQKHMARVDTVRSLCAFVGAASEQQRRWNGVDAYDEKQASNKCSPAKSTT